MLVLVFGKGTRMTGFRRALALAATLNASLLCGAASAQTVIVTRAPADATVELFLNGNRVGSSPASPTGEATLSLSAEARGGRQEMDARLYLDTCLGVRRVQIVERGLEPPVPQSGCARQQLIALFLLRPVTSLVVDSAEGSPDAWLRQGPAPKSWLKVQTEQDSPVGGRSWTPAPSGLAIFGGGGFVTNSDMNTVACGATANCTPNGFRPGFTAGAAFWLGPHIAVEGSYLKPLKISIDGSDRTYAFNSELSADVITVVGKIGSQAGPLRIYGLGGMNYQRSDFTTHQRSGDITYTIDGVTTTLPGGTQTLTFETRGWGWMFGGGVEIWVKPRFAIYGELQRLKLNGTDTRGGDGTLDDQMTTIIIGARFAMKR